MATKLDKRTLINIFATAFYSSFWGCAHTPNFTEEEEKKYITASDDEKENWCREDRWAHILLNGGYITVEDAEEEEEYKLTFEMMEKGWQLAIEKYPRIYAAIAEGQDDFYDDDAVIQLAIFGEIVYG